MLGARWYLGGEAVKAVVGRELSLYLVARSDREKGRPTIAADRWRVDPIIQLCRTRSASTSSAKAGEGCRRLG